MHLPRPIYESVPILYVMASILTLIMVKAPFSIISAFLFAYASWMVWKIRKDHRRRNN